MMENLTPQEKDAVKAGAILAVVLIAGLYYYDFQILDADVKKNSKQVEELKKQITEHKARIKEFDLMAQNMEEVRRQQALLAEVAKRLPKSADPQGFFLALEPVLRATQFEYSELLPQPTAERTAYIEIPYRIVGRSRYHDFGQFLNMIEENPDRLMRIKSFTIENQVMRPSIHPVQVEVASFMFTQKG